MSNKVPIVKVKILETLLFYIGFEAKRQSGSHVFYAIRMEGYNFASSWDQDLGRSLI